MRFLRPMCLPLMAIAAMQLVGCGGGSRPIMTDAQLHERALADAGQMNDAFTEAIDKMIVRMEKAFAEHGEAPTINILAMSGGGDYGAFGAGLLVGWSSVQDPKHKMPSFDAVTGVSTGALLAPFAYLGTPEALAKVEDFYRNPKKDWVIDRGLLFFLPSNPSFMEIPGLDRDVRGVIDAEFVKQMALASEQGRVLAVSATDLDLGRQKFWEVGEEAEKASKDGDLKRVQSILLASAAIPAVFPPVEIDGSVYGDGGVTANVFLRLDVKNASAFLPRWKATHPDKPLPKVRYWIIVNNQIHSPPKTVQVRWPSVIAPSLATAIRSATLAEIRWLAAETDYVNAVYGSDIEVRVTAIPDDWRPPVEGDFQKQTMDSLADLGRKLGADPSSWQLWAAPTTTTASDKITPRH